MTPYDRAFYEMHRARSRRSASEVLPVVLGLLDVRSALDVGCGVGTWLAELRHLGVSDVLGIDGEHVEPSLLQIPADLFLSHDLATPLVLDRTFDLVMSLEVAEHLDEDKAATFVASLTRHGEAVLFSAAIPGQGGDHHVNTQWQSYWAARFEEHGYEAEDVIRPQVWNNAQIEAFYRQNIVLYVRSGFNVPRVLPEMAVLDVVHPEYYLRQMRIAAAPGIGPAFKALARSVRNAVVRRRPGRR